MTLWLCRYAAVSLCVSVTVYVCVCVGSYTQLPVLIVGTASATLQLIQLLLLAVEASEPRCLRLCVADSP